MNVNLLDKKDIESKKITTFMKSCGLSQQIDCLMHVTETTSSLLDHILYNEEDMTINGVLMTPVLVITL